MPISADCTTGRHAIRAVAGHPLNIVQDMQDSAMQVYKLALANNFVQGRQTKTVAAVCLYIACRRSRENNKWMLIDLADKCGVSRDSATGAILYVDLLLIRISRSMSSSWE